MDCRLHGQQTVRETTNLKQLGAILSSSGVCVVRKQNWSSQVGKARQVIMFKADHALKPDLPFCLQTPLLQQQRPHQELEPLNLSLSCDIIGVLQGSCARLAGAGCSMNGDLHTRGSSQPCSTL